MDDKGQLMIMTGFLLAIGLVMLIIIANTMLFTLNLPATEEVSEGKYVENVNYLIKGAAMRAVIDAYTYISTKNATSEEALQLAQNEFLSTISNLEEMYGGNLKALDIDLESLNVTISYIYTDEDGNPITEGNIVRVEQVTFPAGTILIPMDENQYWLREFPVDNTSRLNFMRTYGLLYRILNDRNETFSPLDDSGMDVIVYRLIQDPRENAIDFTGIDSIKHEVLVVASVLYDPNTTFQQGNINKIWSLKGGVIAILPDQLTRSHPTLGMTVEDLILQEAQTMNVTLLVVNQSFSYDYSVMIYKAPRLAVYPAEGSNPGIIEGYFTDAGLTSSEYSLLNTSEIESGFLNNTDILFIPHESLSNYMSDSTARAIMNWVSLGGVLHVECEAIGKDTKNIDGMDDLVENVDTTHPWYGFIGVRYDTNKYGKTLNSTVEDWPFVSNTTYKFTAMSLVQTYTDILPPRGGSVPSFILRGGGLAYNPDSVILLNTSNDLVQTYVFAPFDSGVVVYLGGHDQSMAEGNIPMPEREMIVFDTFFISSIVKKVPVIRLQASLTINFEDDDLQFRKTLSNITAVSNPLLASLAGYATGGTSNPAFPEPEFVDPTDGGLISGTYTVFVNATGTQVILGVDGDPVGNMLYNGTSGLWELDLNTTQWMDGEHILKAIASDGNNTAWTQISVTFQNGIGGGGGAGFEAELKVVEDPGEYEFQLNNLRMADTGQLIQGANVTFKLYAQIVDDNNLIFTGNDVTDSNGFASTTYNGSLDPNATYFLIADVVYNGQLQSFILEFSPEVGNQTGNFIIEDFKIKDLKDENDNGKVDKFKAELKGLSWENGTKIEGASVTFEVFDEYNNSISDAVVKTTNNKGNAKTTFEYPNSLNIELIDDEVYYVKATVVYNGYQKIFYKYFSP